MPTLKELGYPFVFDFTLGIAGPRAWIPRGEAVQDAFRKAMEDTLCIETREKYEMFPKFMDSAAYTKFVADYMVAEREDSPASAISRRSNSRCLFEHDLRASASRL